MKHQTNNKLLREAFEKRFGNVYSLAKWASAVAGNYRYLNVDTEAAWLGWQRSIIIYSEKKIGRSYWKVVTLFSRLCTTVLATPAV